MNVVVGICGLGYGHSIRQSIVISQLLKWGHKVVLFVYGESSAFAGRYFPSVPAFDVWVPWTLTQPDGGVDFAATGNHERNHESGWYSENYRIMGKTLSVFGKAPELVISDYEPVSAHFSYALGCPLVTIDNQSRFLGYQFPRIDGFTPEHETSRLSLYFPKAYRRLSVCFFKIPWHKTPGWEVTITRPAVRREMASACSRSPRGARPNIVVYVSPFGPLRQSEEEIVAELNRCRGVTFTLFTRDATVTQRRGNVVVQPFDKALFAEYMQASQGAVTTAGLNVLSELSLLQKPMYLVPFETYEQRHNAQMIEELGLGRWSSRIAHDELRDFIEEIPEYKRNYERETRPDGRLLCPDAGESLLGHLEALCAPSAS
jgi:uncharacterized protein (TIGR00661 family)